MAQTSCVAFASLFQLDNYIEIFFTGTGMAGLSVCLSKILFIKMYKDSPHQAYYIALTNVVFSSVLTMSVIFFYMTFRKT